MSPHFRFRPGPKLIRLGSITGKSIMIATSTIAKRDFALQSEFSGLYVDDEGLLRRANPDLSVENLYPFCSCYIHTFNGTPFTNSF